MIAGFLCFHSECAAVDKRGNLKKIHILKKGLGSVSRDDTGRTMGFSICPSPDAGAVPGCPSEDGSGVCISTSCS